MEVSLKLLLRVSILAAAGLLLESTLLRFLAVAQFYHFAFLVISLALLGFGASGSFLYLMKISSNASSSNKLNSERIVEYSGLGFAGGVAFSYLFVNILPFDSYSIAWDRKQLIFFFLYYLFLALPFLSVGIGIGGALILVGQGGYLVYAANLLGSGIGALIAPVSLWLAGVPGAMLVSALLGLLCGLSLPKRYAMASKVYYQLKEWSVFGFFLVGWAALGCLCWFNIEGRAPLGINISPYKGLAYLLRVPGSHILYSRWNAYSRVDVLRGGGIHQFPGLSYAYAGQLPPQYGISIDGESVQPITLVDPEGFNAVEYLPEFPAFSLRPRANVLVIEPGGGMGILQSLAGGAEEVTAVLSNSLIEEAIQSTIHRYDYYRFARVETIIETPRIYARRTKDTFDVVFLPLTDVYRPITSGAYSLAETYNLTVEAFVDFLSLLKSDGILVVTRWIQTPPSECIKLIATLVEAMEYKNVPNVKETLVAYRGIQTMTVLVKLRGWKQDELAMLRDFLIEKRYDLVWAPDIEAEETNRFNRLQQSQYYELVRGLLDAPNRRNFYRDYPYAINPATDEKPFFFHFFTWKQTPELVASLGKVWQPFGGSGYFVLLALLGLVLFLSFLLILAPLFIHRPLRIGFKGKEELALRSFAYFGLIGLAFLFIEIPLIQRWILVLGHPTYAFTVVVASLLIGSGLGSMLAKKRWIADKIVLSMLVVVIVIVSMFILRIANISMLSTQGIRLLITISLTMPLGILMGFPFPIGLKYMENAAPEWIPWIWGINGCASVISSVLAAIFALSYGFHVVMIIGALAYLGALLMLPCKGDKANGT